MSKVFLFIFLVSTLYAKTFTVASYNVENLFDLNKNSSDYSEYVPNTKTNWNQKTFTIKLNNLLQVLKDLDADIIGLQEVESKELMQLLLKKLPQYKYYSFSKYDNSSVGLGFLSKIKITANQDIKVKFVDKIFRPILETTFELENIEFKIFNNHWPSKKVSESYRVKYAKFLFDRVNTIAKDYDYILLGDFNSNYDEYQTIYKENKLNNTNGITGINQVLNTTIDKRYITYEDVLHNSSRVHYNLWLELPYAKRFSNKFRNFNTTPDNILLSPALFDNKKISYKLKSFNVFMPEYLYKNGNIFRWEIKNRIHQGSGFSDHLPIFASFTTNKEEKNPLKKLEKKETSRIEDFYNKQKLIEPIQVDNVVVLYKNGSDAIIKQKNGRAIYCFNNAQSLQEGHSYSIEVKQIKDYFGLKEIEKFTILQDNGYEKEYKQLYLQANKIDFINDEHYQNEMIENIQGIYNRGYITIQGNKIRLFVKDKNISIPNNATVHIRKAQIGFYKTQAQLVIHHQRDIHVD